MAGPLGVWQCPDAVVARAGAQLHLGRLVADSRNRSCARLANHGNFDDRRFHSYQLHLFERAVIRPAIIDFSGRFTASPAQLSFSSRMHPVAISFETAICRGAVFMDAASDGLSHVERLLLRRLVPGRLVGRGARAEDSGGLFPEHVDFRPHLEVFSSDAGSWSFAG